MECQLATHFSCHCPKCVDGATNYLNYCYNSTSSDNNNQTSKNNNNNDDSFVFYTPSRVSSCDTTNNNNNNNNENSSSSSNGDEQNDDDDDETVSFHQTTTSTTSISYDEKEEEEEYDEKENQHQYLKRLAKNKKWEKKLRRLQFLERASFTPGSFARTYANPRRDYNEFGIEYYEIFELDRPKSLAPRVLHATETGIFYPKRSETLRYLARKNYSVRGIGRSLFTREGQCPEAVRLCRPFDHVGKYDDKGHFGKFDERGWKNLDQKHLHYKKDRRVWLKKQAARKQQQQQQQQESTYDNEDEEQEEEEEQDYDNTNEWDDSLIGWMWAGKNNNKDHKKNGNKKFQQHKNFKKGGKFNLWEDDFENYHHW